MATKLENLELEVAQFNNFKKYIPGMNRCCEQTVAKFLSMGLIQVSTAFEHAVASVGGNQVVSEDSHDISDGSDTKLSCVRTARYGTLYSAPITNIKGKTGKLRVQVYERKQDKFYYFVIPNRAYRDIPTSSNIEIPFEMDGSPRRIPARQRTYANWWKYEVNDFKELATA